MGRKSLLRIKRDIAGCMACPGPAEARAAALGLSRDQLAALHWVAWIPGPAPGDAGRLSAGFADNGVKMPSCLWHPADGASSPLEAVRGFRPQAQALSIELANTAHSHGAGTLTCLLRNRTSGGLLALTAGHVLGGHGESTIHDAVALQSHGSQRHLAAARLENWQPVFHVGTRDTTIDAAVASLTLEAAESLLQGGLELPARTAGFTFAERWWLKTRSTDLAAAPRSYVTSWIDLNDGGATQDYKLVDGIGYDAHSGTQGGDSGAPIWNDGGELVAMHVSAGVGGGKGNAIAVPIRRVLDWCDADLITRDEGLQGRETAPAQGIAAPQIAPPAATAGKLPDDVDVLARTIWGEARGEPDPAAAMTAVANVVLNRVKRQTYWGRTIEEVCRKPYQFSCWNAGDRNRPKMLAVTRQDREFVLACAIAENAVAHQIADNTKGATHYYSRRMPAPPRWARRHACCETVGNHLFFNDID